MSARQSPQSYDVEAIRAAARGRWQELLARLGGVSPDVLDGGHHPCPRCGGNDRFRFTNRDGDGSCICNQCLRTGGGNGFDVLGWLASEKFGSTIKRVADYLGFAPVAKSPASPAPSPSSRVASGSGSSSPPTNSRKPHTTGERPDPSKHLKFKPWNESLAALWCLHKPPITSAALLAVGARLARYRDQFNVIAIPIHGPKLDAEPPVGWVLYSLSGGTLPRYEKDPQTGKFRVAEWIKVKVASGSQKGLIGDMKRFVAAAVVWKVEGPSDLLTMFSLADLPSDHAAVTNANGAGERAESWIVDHFRGKQVRVAHDADDPGQRGANGYTDERQKFHPGWAVSIASTADDCRNVVLPYEVAPSHGKDLRDYLGEFVSTDGRRRSYADLQALADSSQPLAAEPLPEPVDEPIEADNDPHRLARINLARYAASRPNAKIRYWRDEWYAWKGTHYRRIKKKEFQAKVTASVRLEFERIWRQKMQEYQDWVKSADYDTSKDEGPPVMARVTRTLITDILNATAGMTIISSSIELMTWIEGVARERRNFVAMHNGLLDIDAVMADKEPEECTRPHSPDWFSTVCLPYDFNVDATCPRWEAFLEKSLEMDPERIKILQEWAGYLLVHDTGEQKFLVLEGEGNNGKSVFCAGMAALLGKDNCAHIPLEQFGDRFAKTQTVGKLVNIAADVGELDKVAEGYVKSFTSGDVMYFDKKGVEGMESLPTARLMLACNNRPRFSDRTSGIWRRMLLIPWRVKVSKEERVRNMDKPWWWEQSGELPGMFLWALQGLARLRAQGGFTESSLSEEAIEDYQLETNPTKAFLVEHFEEAEGEKQGVQTSFVYGLYRRWMEANGHRSLGEKLFGKEFHRNFPNSEKKRGGGRADRYYFYSKIKFATDEICGEKTYEGQLF